MKWASVAGGANYKESDTLDMLEDWQGLTVPVLNSGYLLIEFSDTTRWRKD